MAEPAQVKAVHDADQAIAAARTIGSCVAACYCGALEGGMAPALAAAVAGEYLKLLMRPAV